MIFLYTSLLAFLGVLKVLTVWRARSLERKYARVAASAGKTLRETGLKEGNSNRTDPFLYAKRQYELGQLVSKRERLEARHHTWQVRAERLNRVVRGLRGWRGRKLPYTLGVLDVWGTMYLIDYLGLGQYVSAQALVEAVTALVSNG